MIQDRRLRVEVSHAEARYALADGGQLEIAHHGQPVGLTAGKPQARPIPAAPSPPGAACRQDASRRNARPPRTRAAKPWP